MSKNTPPIPQRPQHFSAFTLKHNGIARRILSDIHLTPAFNPNEYMDKPAPYELLKKWALWDTGATNSVITTSTAKELNLTEVGVTNVVHYGGTKQSSRYMVNLFLPNRVVIAGVLVTGSEDIVGQDFDVIIGMDIISSGDFSITNENGLTCMSYRHPSIATIDFVWEVERIRYAGSDKYGPCPCGKKDENGKPVKYKFCHGRMS